MFRTIIRQYLKPIGFQFYSTTAKPTEQKITIDNINLNYIHSGSDAAESKTVLLMPGAIGSGWNDFGPQIDSLPKLLPNWKIIAWDPPGYGKSRPPKRKFNANFYHDDANYAKKLMDELGTKRFSILGWSDGGITGMILSAQHPEAVDRLVIWGSNAYFTREEIELYKKMRDVSTWSQRMREPMEAIYGREGFTEIWSDWIDGCIEIQKERNGDICRGDLAKIQAPTMILHGRKDPMVAAEHVPYLLKHINGVKYHEFPEGKHNIHLRYADEFNKLVAEFLNTS